MEMGDNKDATGKDEDICLRNEEVIFSSVTSFQPVNHLCFSENIRYPQKTPHTHSYKHKLTELSTNPNPRFVALGL